MKLAPAFAIAALSLAATASGQQFARLHGMVPTDLELLVRAVTDIDADGDLDIVSTRFGELVLLRNRGAARFDVEVVLPTIGRSPTQISAAELTGDGRVDIVLQDDRELRLLVAQPNGTFALQPGAFPAMNDLRKHGLGDVDGDGDVDVAVSSTFLCCATDQLFLNDGNGVFTDASSKLGNGTHKSLTLLDVDGDGDLDAVGSNPDELLRNDGAGTFTVDASASVPPIGGTHIEAFDLDEDGDLDLLFGLADFEFAANDGTGNFVAIPTGVLPPGATPGIAAWELIDWNGSGGMDLVVRLLPDQFGASNGLRIFRNVGGGTFQAVPSPLLDNAEHAFGEFLAEDLDGDGDGDILASVVRGELFLNRGEGAFELALIAPESFEDDYDEVVLGDIDDDGYCDAAVIAIDRSTGVRAAHWIRNDGAGSFETPRFLTGSSIEVALADVEGDGDLDVLSVGTGSSGLRLLIQAEDGSFANTPSNLPALSNLLLPDTADIDVGDLNGDGFDDLVITVEKSPGDLLDYILLNDGTGSFTLSAASSLIPIRAFSSELGDLDGDGDLDAVIASIDPNAKQFYQVFLNPGDGSLAPTPGGITLNLQSVDDFLLADMNGDGSLDLLVHRFDQIKVFEGKGDGTFGTGARAKLPLAPMPPSSGTIATLDFDLDGDLDVFGNAGFLFRNEGGWSFTDASSSLSDLPRSSSGARFAVGDIDQDGDPDIWLGGESEIHWNLQRQIAWDSWPRIGHTLTMELHGSPMGYYNLLLSPSTSLTPTAFGWIRIQLTGAYHAAQGLLDADGTAMPSFLVPQDLSLVGTAFFWQAALGSPVRTSNLEVMQLSDV
ncbi:MAG TPA: VCBS repeat-containing protein [Planctomycetes bacterium]|nr:VCBS repeat-containing protein [Planctomycetota bacterium]